MGSSQALSRVFLLSPAHTGGKRAGYVFNDAARFELARKLRTPAGAPVGEVFTFLSGLYFRGKVAYAKKFAPAGAASVITSDRGLIDVDESLTIADLRAMAAVDVDAAEERYRRPLERDVERLARRIGPDGEAVLLGSVATGKYVDVLVALLGGRLKFPKDFVGRGDMSRGALMLRCAAAGTELEYVSVSGATRTGRRAGRVADWGGR